MIEGSAARRSAMRHRERWGEPALVAVAPGRVNLIGEHTDYNEGFVVPMALPFATAVALSNRGDPVDGTVEIDSTGFGQVDLEPHADPGSAPDWALHAAGVIALLREVGIDAGGWRATIDTDIPTGASLSSSAALEVALISALVHRAGATWTPTDVARLGQRVENEVVGLPSGIMDQLISAGAVAGCATMIDCRDLTMTPTPLPPGVAVTIMDTGTRRVLADAAYGDRRAACQRAATAIGVTALRDARVDQLDRVADPVDRRRARHVITENERAVQAAAAMRDGDARAVGRLMSASHDSLRDDFEVSGPGLDAIVDLAHGIDGCLGARMTGGGFAGCAVALVGAGAVDQFERAVVDRYRFDGHTARVWTCEPADGARVLAPDEVS